MTTNHAEPTIITYGSQYGSAEHYARKFAEYTGFSVLPYREVKSTAGYDRIVHFGALYAGGVMGLKHLVPLLSAQTRLVVVTVGLADVQDAGNTDNIRRSVQRRLPEEVWARTVLYHLRGAIDYGKLNVTHRTMMALLYRKVKKTPEEERSAETRAMLETYGKRVSFISDAALRQLTDTILDSCDERKDTP